MNDIEKRLAALERAVQQMRKNMPEPHRIQGKTLNLIERDPGDIKESDIKEREFYWVDDEKNGESYILTRIKGNLKTVVLSSVT